jgi:hypothetical protein
MKIKVELAKGESVEQADEFLAKALAAKTECDHGERYSDNAMNEAHDHICGLFNHLTKDLHSTVKDIIEDATGTKSPR